MIFRSNSPYLGGHKTWIELSSYGANIIVEIALKLCVIQLNGCAGQ